MTRFCQHHKSKNFKTQKPKIKARKGQVNILVLNVFVFGLITCGLVGYVAQINSLATKGYQIKDLQTQANQLKQENSQLETKVSNLQALDTLRSKVSQLNMVPIGKTDYLSSSAVAVASIR